MPESRLQRCRELYPELQQKPRMSLRFVKSYDVHVDPRGTPKWIRKQIQQEMAQRVQS